MDDNKYQVGQVWAYHTRHGEEQSLLTIVAIDNFPGEETIFHISLHGLRIKDSNMEKGFSDGLSHAPFSREALDRSVTSLIRWVSELPITLSPFGW